MSKLLSVSLCSSTTGKLILDLKYNKDFKFNEQFVVRNAVSTAMIYSKDCFSLHSLYLIMNLNRLHLCTLGTYVLTFKFEDKIIVFTDTKHNENDRLFINNNVTFINWLTTDFYIDALPTALENINKECINNIIITNHTDYISNEYLRPDCYFFYDVKNKTILSYDNITSKQILREHKLSKLFIASTI